MGITQTLQLFAIIVKTEIICKNILKMPSAEAWIWKVLKSYNERGGMKKFGCDGSNAYLKVESV